MRKIGIAFSIEAGKPIFTLSLFRKPFSTPSLATATVAPFSSAALTPLVASLLLTSASEKAQANEAAHIKEAAMTDLEKWGINMLSPGWTGVG